MKRTVQLGVIEFHSDRANPGLRQRFHAVTEDLRAAGCIVDLWLMDIATVLREFGYYMQITTDKELPARSVTPQEPQPMTIRPERNHWLFVDERGDEWSLTPTHDPSMPLVVICEKRAPSTSQEPGGHQP